MYQVNPNYLIQMIKQGQNPQQLLLSVLEGSANTNPMSANLLSLAKQGNTQEMERIARNILSQRGLDYDVEFNALLRLLGKGR